MSPDDELLTERITIRFTESELRDIRKAMHSDGMRKESAFLRRVIVLYLQKKGYVDGAGRFSASTSILLNEDAPSTPVSAKRSGISRK
jgi:hypothetical protein